MAKIPSTETITKLLHLIEGDVETSISKLNSASSEDMGFYSRSYIRAYASWIEGSVWIYKTLISKVEYQWHTDLPIESQLLLFEMDWKLEGSGKPKLIDKKIDAKDNLKGFFFVMSQMFDDFKADFSDSGWNDVLSFYSIRDRLMHPNGNRSLDISKDELKRCDRGRVWLQSQFGKLRSCVTTKIDE